MHLLFKVHVQNCCLDKFSAFKFESSSRFLKLRIHIGICAFEQAVNRIFKLCCRINCRLQKKLNETLWIMNRCITKIKKTKRPRTRPRARISQESHPGDDEEENEGEDDDCSRDGAGCWVV